MISREELLENLVLNLEKERVRLGYSQAQMASALHMSLSSYKRLICGESRKIDFYTVFLAQKSYGDMSLPQHKNITFFRICPNRSAISSPTSSSLNMIFPQTSKTQRMPMTIPP